MASSPDRFERLDGGSDYMRGWESLGAMIAQGRSFSGHERNCAFLNTGSGDRRFADVSGALGLDHDDDGRAVIPADWDGDGDLDLWLANRTGPRLRFLRNDLREPGSGWLALKLRGVDCNRDAIGARVAVTVGGGRKVVRSLRAGDGFASQTPKTLHFGLGDAAGVEEVRVFWPGGDPEGEVFSGAGAGAVFSLMQGTGVAEPVPRRTNAVGGWSPSDPAAPAPTRSKRIVLGTPSVIPPLDYIDFAGRARPLAEIHGGKALLVILWSKDCSECMAELPALVEGGGALAQAGVRTIALSTDTIGGEGAASDVRAAEAALADMGWGSVAGLAPIRLVRALNIVHEHAVYPEGPLTLPAGFLLDGAGRVAVLYRGAVPVETLVRDASLALSRDPSVPVDDLALPFPGRDASAVFALDATSLANAYRAAGDIAGAREALRKGIAERSAGEDPRGVATLLWHLADLEESEGDYPAALAALDEAVRRWPQNPSLRLSLAAATAKSGAVAEADRLFDQLVARAPGEPGWLRQIGKVCTVIGRVEQAISVLESARQLAPDDPQLRFDLAIAYERADRAAQAVPHYRTLVGAGGAGALDAANNLAWLFATHPDDRLRDGAEAVRLALEVVEATGRQSASVLDTLAAAQAEAGDFGEALATAAEAAVLAMASGEPALASQIEARAKRYRSGQPHRAAFAE